VLLRWPGDLSKVEGVLGLAKSVALTRCGKNEPSESEAGNGVRSAKESARDSTATPHVVENAAAVGRKTTSKEARPFGSKLSARRQPAL
jgi:hypothetical protein